MIKHKKTESLNQIMDRFLCENGLMTPLNQYRIIKNWPNIVNEKIASSTIDIFIKNQTLYVKLNSSIIKSELQMIKSRIIEKLNQSVQSHLIVDIIVL